MDGARYTEGVNGALTGAEAAASVQSSDCGSCLQRIRGCVPLDHWNEIVQLLKLGGPVVISQLMVFMISIVSMMFCGHQGKTELAGVSLAVAVVNITGISIGTGLSSTCDTLISQTYGSGNLKRVGVILQRGILILLLACFPCWAVLINTEPLLLALRQSAEVASLTQLYVKIFMPALPVSLVPFFLHDPISFTLPRPTDSQTFQFDLNQNHRCETFPRPWSIPNRRKRCGLDPDQVA
ncbi:multidrug and toxin extrusion protein 1 [Larimichthys crocea]|uniref:multidrug and toxin extrusion protein 1 n=1 Tax=Larimichthys crocea TaxID=215358 RepID=UPI000F5E6FD9|nr:multidrug and toxin extrusion protein 1 [Larimichthys crocea]